MTIRTRWDSDHPLIASSSSQAHSISLPSRRSSIASGHRIVSSHSQSSSSSWNRSNSWTVHLNLRSLSHHPRCNHNHNLCINHLSKCHTHSQYTVESAAMRHQSRRKLQLWSKSLNNCSKLQLRTSRVT